MYKTGREVSFLNSLKNGITLSRRQVSHLFKLANPSAAVGRFVDSGIPIVRSYSKRKSDGVEIVKYSLAQEKKKKSKK